MKIDFSRPTYGPHEREFMRQSIESGRLAGNGPFTRRAEKLLYELAGARCALLTSSGTHALEMAVLLAGIEPGDEVVLPSFTFTSTATAVALFRGRPIFVDIREDTLNIDERLIESALSDKTKAIVVVHYGGVAANMSAIVEIASRHRLMIIEDAAHAIDSYYQNRHLGTIGDFGCLSFHETKNLSCGEGGAILVNRSEMVKRAEVLREKGTDRAAFFRGEVDRYTWLDIGSSYLVGDLNAAILCAQLEQRGAIRRQRLEIWDCYYRALLPLKSKGLLRLPSIPDECRHNAHIFYIITSSPSVRSALLDYLHRQGVHATFHYVPLHSSPAGKKYGQMRSTDHVTNRVSECLIRLPLYAHMTGKEQESVVESIYRFFGIRMSS